jgi:hypothetical protein
MQQKIDFPFIVRLPFTWNLSKYSIWLRTHIGEEGIKWVWGDPFAYPDDYNSNYDTFLFKEEKDASLFCLMCGD